VETDRWMLTLSVHFDAFCNAPLAYLTVIWWWLLGKRLRARGQLAPLLSQSPRSYALWALQQDREDDTSDAEAWPPILAVIDVRAGQDGLAATICSLSAQFVPALLVGTDAAPTLIDAASTVDWSDDQWLMPMAPGDIISPGGIRAYRNAITAAGSTEKASRIIYADDDLLDKRGRRHSPHFKPDWNSELFRHFDYLTGSCIIRTSLRDLRLLKNDNAPDWPHQLVAHAASQSTPLHLRSMLHHRLTRPIPRDPAEPAAMIHDLPLVTIIIPTRNHVELLRTCMDGVAATTYPNLEVIVVDNDSNDPETLAYLERLNPLHTRVLRYTGPFNYSAINNHAAQEARGEFLCLLNNDIEIIETSWLAIMVVQAQRDDVGAVGARLLYPDGRIQHAGVVIGVGNAAGHAHRFLDPDEEGYFRRHALPQFTTAVTAACLVVQKERFLAVGGLDELNFPVAFNDVDLCLRLNQRGWQSFFEPRATLIHHESVSRGTDKDPIGAARFAQELAALQRLWQTDAIVDRYHHPQLSRASERFAVAL
tara:strand:+ start:7417 stop:9024 length:1608 start_codon:yes stop_codon:yes gene_type:complete